MSKHQIADINPFEIADTDRDNMAYLMEEIEKLKIEHKLLMSVVTMLATAEQFRINTHVIRQKEKLGNVTDDNGDSVS